MASSKAKQFISTVSYLQVILIIVQPALSVTIAEEWKNVYTEVFDQTGQTLNDLRIMKHVTFMYETSQKVATDGSISQVMINNVMFWYRALSDTNKAHCKVEYMDVLRQNIEQIRDPLTPNLVALFTLAHSNLVEFCSDSFVYIKDALNSKFDFGDRSSLTMMQNHYTMYFMGKLPKKKLGKELFGKLGVLKTCSVDKIKKAWQNGPCGKLKTYMIQLSSPVFDDYVEFVNYGLLATEPHRLSTIYWAKIVYACIRLDSMILDLARDNDICTVTGRKIKSAIDSLGH